LLRGKHELGVMNNTKIYSNIGYSPIYCFGSNILHELSKTSKIVHQNNFFSFGMFDRKYSPE